MCENITICMKIKLLLDICVKYAQCVKIWSFGVLVLFLKCVQFLKSCVQFLMDTILNLAIILFLMNKKGDAPMKHASRILGEGAHTHTMCVSYLRRRETRPRNAHLISQERASTFYLTCMKRISTDYSP
jgi:hypothetical protein